MTSRPASQHPWWLLSALLLTQVVAAEPPAAAPPPAQLYVARARQTLDPTPIVQDGALVGPWAPIARAMGARVNWYGAENLLVMVGPAGKRVQVQPGQPLTVDQRPVPLTPAATLVAGKLIGPVKPLVEALDGVLQWNPTTRCGTIYGKLLRLETRGDERGVGLSIVTSIPVSPALVNVLAPRRSYVDLAGVYLNDQLEVNYVNTCGLKRVRCGQLTMAPPVTRVVLDLDDEAPSVQLQPREDDCGGRLVVGELDGDEPILRRLGPKLLKVTATSHDPNTLTVTAFLSDPVTLVYDVLRQPYRVLVDLGGAEVAKCELPAAEPLPFLDQVKLIEQGRMVLYMTELVPFTVKTLTDPDRVQVVFARDTIVGKKIAIDAGHGGKDSGARGSYLLEKDINLDMARRTVQRLAALSARPFLTRERDEFVDLYARPRMANDLAADLFVSIHCNATGGGWTGSGTGTYHYRLRSKELAVVMQDTLIAGLKTRDYGVHCENFCVTRETAMTAILIETLFIDNKAEEKLLDKPEFRQQVANNVCEGIRRYLEGTNSIAPALLQQPSG